jgi:hypothetical protein
LRYELIQEKLFGIYPDYLAKFEYLLGKSEKASEVQDQGIIWLSLGRLTKYYVLKYLSEHKISGHRFFSIFYML